ncbi:hypothetical protein BIV57_13160 [Mangrovactinospora gilvigrisea]|uniref:Uncharacterized protein n=1 Tax=Mangrovactinospora gilvigrisea TaxID=1428644 RepID=A0A1J7BED1_9ACTN|nr:hypothetical protein BIV57_13160 [Mangrovactinospora gilvigrisea]
MTAAPRGLRADGAFWALLAVGALERAALATATCCLATELAARAARLGAVGLVSGSPSPLPAVAAVALTVAGA